MRLANRDTVCWQCSHGWRWVESFGIDKDGDPCCVSGCGKPGCTIRIVKTVPSHTEESFTWAQLPYMKENYHAPRP